MNKIKVISLLLVAALMLPVLAACSDGALPAKNVTVIFRVPVTEGVDEDGKTIYARDENGDIKYEEKFKYDLASVEPKTEIMDNVYDENGQVVTDSNGNKVTEPVQAPTVLQAVQEALLEFELDYELSADGTYIASAFGLTEQQRTDSEKGYYDFWECTINDITSDSGRQSVTKIYDNDVIVYTWTSGERNRQDTAAVDSTDPNAETTGVIHSDDTTVPVDSNEEVA